MVWVMTLIHASYAGDSLNDNDSIRNYKDASIQTTKTKPSGYRKHFILWAARDMSVSSHVNANPQIYM